jgi:hypothetical protein
MLGFVSKRDTFSDAPKLCRETVAPSNLTRVNHRPPTWGRIGALDQSKVFSDTRQHRRGPAICPSIFHPEGNRLVVQALAESLTMAYNFHTGWDFWLRGASD